MIVGTSIHHQHPVFRDFPTSYYADWQWWDILNYAGAIDLTALTGLTPIIQSVDTYEVNRKLGIAFEAQVGKGKLFFLNLDLSKRWTNARLPINCYGRSVNMSVRQTSNRQQRSLCINWMHCLPLMSQKESKHKEMQLFNNY